MKSIRVAATLAALTAGTPATGPRQFCRKGIHSCIPALTLTFRAGAGALHWCADHVDDAEPYLANSDQATPVQRIAGQLDGLTDTELLRIQALLDQIAADRFYSTR